MYSNCNTVTSFTSQTPAYIIIFSFFCIRHQVTTQDGENQLIQITPDGQAHLVQLSTDDSGIQPLDDQPLFTPDQPQILLKEDETEQQVMLTTLHAQISGEMLDTGPRLPSVFILVLHMSTAVS